MVNTALALAIGNAEGDGNGQWAMLKAILDPCSRQ
jgi:hypothetical protein